MGGSATFQGSQERQGDQRGEGPSCSKDTASTPLPGSACPPTRKRGRTCPPRTGPLTNEHAVFVRVPGVLNHRNNVGPLLGQVDEVTAGAVGKLNCVDQTILKDSRCSDKGTPSSPVRKACCGSSSLLLGPALGHNR